MTLGSAKIPVEDYFNEFVEEFGGELVSKLLPKNPPFDNADYFFSNRAIVAELKCLEKNTGQDPHYQDKLIQLVKKWVRAGLVSRALLSQRSFESRNLPRPCQLELSNLLKPYVERPIKKANRQIRETIDHFGLKDAKGVLLLVNDGNYTFETDYVVWLALRCIEGQFTSIHTLIYFTVNMWGDIPGINSDLLFWGDGARVGAESLPREFHQNLSDGWSRFLEKKTGIKIPMIKAEPDWIDRIKFINQPAAVKYR